MPHINTNKLQTHNIISQILINQSHGIIPEVGMGITVCYYTDREAGTITRVSKNKKKFWFKEDKAIRTDNYGMSDTQHYEYSFNADAPEREAKFSRKYNGYVTGGSGIILGRRDKYFDFSF